MRAIPIGQIQPSSFSLPPFPLSSLFFLPFLSFPGFPGLRPANPGLINFSSNTSKSGKIQDREFPGLGTTTFQSHCWGGSQWHSLTVGTNSIHLRNLSKRTNHSLMKNDDDANPSSGGGRSGSSASSSSSASTAGAEKMPTISSVGQAASIIAGRNAAVISFNDFLALQNAADSSWASTYDGLTSEQANDVSLYERYAHHMTFSAQNSSGSAYEAGTIKNYLRGAGLSGTYSLAARRFSTRCSRELVLFPQYYCTIAL